MALDGRQFQRIHDALLGGYNETTLQQMVKFEMNEDLDRVVGPGSLEARVFALVGWADRSGRIRELVQAAHNRNQTNEALEAVYQEWFAPETVATSGALPVKSPLSPQVFLAYSNKDKQLMQQLQRMLVDAGFSVWTDEGLRAGKQRWEQEIQSAIERTKCMVVILTPDAKQSRWVNREVLYALSLDRPLIPLLTRDTIATAVPISLIDVQLIDARRNYAEAITDKLVPELTYYLRLGETVPSQQITEGETRWPVQVVEDLPKVEAQPAVENPVARRPTERTPKPAIEFDLATIPASQFILSKEAGGETVTLPKFRISKQPVTNAQYKAFVDATGKGEAPEGDAERPVVNVSWNDASAFCEWASKETGQKVRLPTEAEWEKAMAELGIKDTEVWERTGTEHEKYTGAYVHKRMREGITARRWANPADWSRYYVFRVVVADPEWFGSGVGGPSTQARTVTPEEFERPFGGGSGGSFSSFFDMLFGQRDQRVGTQTNVAGDLVHGDIEFEWVTIPAGEFLYGDDKRRVYLEAFQISRTPVTNRQYQTFVDATGHDRPKHWEGRRVHPSLMNHPVMYVSWDDAQAFCDWAGVFLPTEQQWEKAARGTDGRKYPWGNEEPTDKLCNFNNNVGTTTPVSSYSPQGDSPYGVADMAGNVWEWCEGWYNSDHKDPPLRGGSFWVSVGWVRCAYRGGLDPGYRNVRHGFRVVVSSTGF